MESKNRFFICYVCNIYAKRGCGTQGIPEIHCNQPLRASAGIKKCKTKSPVNPVRDQSGGQIYAILPYFQTHPAKNRTPRRYTLRLAVSNIFINFAVVRGAPQCAPHAENRNEMTTDCSISVVTSTRADWGLLKDIVLSLKEKPGMQVSVIATNMHLDPAYGMTVDEITADGIEVDARVEMIAEGDSAADTARATARCLEGMADAFDRLKPDMVLLLGDRYEMLAVATAATIMRIPIIHIAGGEISEGAIDDNIRHALTKLSSLHLTATETYRRRVISMGEDPARVINTGAIGVYNLMNEPVMPKRELEASIGMEITPGTLLVTLHPATMDNVPADVRAREMLDALDSFPDSHIIFTYPNNDPEGSKIISTINAYAERNPSRTIVIPSLGRKRYLSALHYVSAVAGNSSSGIVEVPSMHIPTVDIGIRQRGRMAGDSVIHCDADAASIRRAIAFALSDEGRKRAMEAENPYYRPDTLHLIVEAICNTSPESLKHKRFIDHQIILPACDH